MSTALRETRYGLVIDECRAVAAAPSQMPTWRIREALGAAADALAVLHVIGQLAACRDNGTWGDLGPRLTCREADLLAQLFSECGHEGACVQLMEAHAASDEEGDTHWQGD